MIKTLKTNRINVDKRGKITTGIKAKNERGVEYPKATDYFVIDDFPELKALYGDKPKKLLVAFASDVIEDFFASDYVLYGSNNQMIRKCDGEECLHRIDENLQLVSKFNPEGEVEELPEPTAKKYVAGEISECCCKLMPPEIEKDGKKVKNTKLCSNATYLKALIVNFNSGKYIAPLCYHFYSGSENTASNIISELRKTLAMFGVIKGLPFVLSVDMVSGKTNAIIKYPIWNLQIAGTMAQLERAVTQSYLFDYKEVTKLGQPEQKEIEGHKPEDKTMNQSLNEKEQQEIIEKQNPGYWIDQINSQKSYTELTNFEKEFHLELTMFGGEDEQVLKKAIEAKRRQLLK